MTILAATVWAVPGGAATTPWKVAERVSVSSSGGNANSNVFYSGEHMLAVSANGQYVTFCSNASNVVPGTSGFKERLYLRDRGLGRTELLSEGGCGARMSDSGRVVAFNGDGGLAILDRRTGVRQVISQAYVVDMTPDARFVALLRSSGDGFLLDRSTGTERPLRINGRQFPLQAWQSFRLAKDGRTAAFTSADATLAPEDGNTASDVFLFDVATETVRLVSAAPDGSVGNQYSTLVAFPPSGQKVLYRTSATNIDKGTGGHVEYDVATGVSAPVNYPASNVRDFSRDLRYAVGVGFVYDRVTGEAASIVGSDGSTDTWGVEFNGVLTPDAKYAVFTSRVDGLVPDDTNGYVDVFVAPNPTANVPVASVLPVAVFEENSGAPTAGVTISLDRAAPTPVTVNYTTADRTARAPADYTAKVGSVTVPAGARSTIVNLSLVGDAAYERTEEFELRLLGATGAVANAQPGVVTVVNDDVAPRIVARDATVKEGTGGSTYAEIALTLSPGGSDAAVWVDTVPDTAVEPTDYRGVTQRVLVTSATPSAVRIRVVADSVDEPDESFLVRFADPSDGRGPSAPVRITIQDDD